MSNLCTPMSPENTLVYSANVTVWYFDQICPRFISHGSDPSDGIHPNISLPDVPIDSHQSQESLAVFDVHVPPLSPIAPGIRAIIGTT